MKVLSSGIEIAAPAERVWEILTDFPSYSEWNPFMREIQGSAEVGSRLAVRVDPSWSMAMTVRPRLVSVVPNRELRWFGHLMFVPRLFDGEHSFLIERAEQGNVRFVQQEKLSGLVAVVFPGRFQRATEHDWDRMNQALKERAEQI